MAMKASDIVKKKGSTEEKSKKAGKSNPLLDWIGNRRKAGKKPVKVAKKEQEEDDGEE